MTPLNSGDVDYFLYFYIEENETYDLPEAKCRRHQTLLWFPFNAINTKTQIRIVSKIADVK